MDFSENHVKAFIVNKCEGQVDPGLFMYNLWQYAGSLGVMIMTGMEVLEFSDSNAGSNLVVEHNGFEESIHFQTQNLVFCTNAFSKTFFQELDVYPGEGKFW